MGPDDGIKLEAAGRRTLDFNLAFGLDSGLGRRSVLVQKLDVTGTGVVLPAVVALGTVVALPGARPAAEVGLEALLLGCQHLVGRTQ